MEFLRHLLRHTHVALSVALFFLLAALLTGCKPDANADIISPELGARMVAAASSNAVVAAEPTPVPRLADLSPDQVVAGLDDEFLAALQSADLAGAEALALSNGCVGCHALDPNEVRTGPTWHNLGDTAVGRVTGESPALYLHQSIVAPNEHVVAGYPQGVMPAIYGDTMSIEDLASMVAYLLSQQGQ